MKIIAFSDIHGAYEEVERILTRESAYDIIILGGDLTTAGSASEAEAAMQSFQSHGKPVLGVAGNMDPQSLEASFSKLKVSINGRGEVIQEVGFFGVSAAPLSPLHTPYEIPEDEIQRLAESGWKDVEKAKRRIFVPHAPPKDTKLDKVHVGFHVGSTAVRKFIEQKQPDVVICGHIHEARGMDSIGKAQIVNCGPAGKGYYAWLELSDAIKVENRG